MSDYLLAVAAALDVEPPCSCVDTLRGLDRDGCPTHDPAGEQWRLDHPDGVISPEEDESMARYAYEACRLEGCRNDHDTAAPVAAPGGAVGEGEE